MDNSKFPAGEGQQIDDLFRKALGDHRVEPPEELWKGVDRKLLWNEIAHLNFTNVSTGVKIGSVAVVLLAILLLIFYPRENQTTRPNLPAAGETAVAPKTKTAPSVTPATGSEPGAISSTAAEKPVTAAVSEKMAAGKHRRLTPQSPVTQGKPEPAARINTAPEMEKSVIIPKEERDRETLLAMNSLGPEGWSLGMQKDTVLTFKTPQGIMNVQKVKPSVPQSFSGDFGVTPEWISYKTTESYSEMNYWLNARVSYHISRFSVTTGVSLGYVFDEGKYQVKYLSKDSIGYFTSIISFYINPENQNEIIFNTKDIAVYDSLQHYADDRTRNRYTYLELPLIFGYRLFETNTLSLDLMAGPTFSFLIGTRKAQPYIDYPNARIIKIDDNTPQRAKTDWKISLGLHLEYRVNKNLGCYLEPSYQYFFNSYSNKEQSASRDPFSIRLGLGIRYYFGHINK